jgi:hypothetical protein
VTFTVAPEITDPVLSVTVPEKLPFAWPYSSGLTQNTTEQKITTINVLLISIDIPLALSRLEFGASLIRERSQTWPRPF